MGTEKQLRMSLRQVLLGLGLINEQQYEEVWDASNRTENKLPELLIMLGMLTEAQIIKAVGITHQAPYFEKLDGLVDPDAAHLLTEKVCREYLVVPMFRDGSNLMVAMLNPYDIPTMEIISDITGLRVKPVVSTRKAIYGVINKIFSDK